MKFNNQDDESTTSEHYSQDSYEVEEVTKNIGRYNLEDIMNESMLDKETAIVSIAVLMHKDFGGDYDKILEEVNNQLK